jgi:hypothetical protein
MLVVSATQEADAGGSLEPRESPNFFFYMLQISQNLDTLLGEIVRWESAHFGY